MSASWGLIADVHGNLPALDRALRLLEAAGAQRYAFLGDYLGRGDSDACARRIQQVATVAVVGNRDLDWQDRVAPETRAWVLGLATQRRRRTTAAGAWRRAADASVEHRADQSRLPRRLGRADGPRRRRPGVWTQPLCAHVAQALGGVRRPSS